MNCTDIVVLFDLDGTLVDTAPDLHAALVYSFQSQNLEAIDLATVRSAIGHGAKAMIKRSAELSGHELAPDQLDEMLEQFLEYYRSNICRDSAPFDGITQTLEFCRTQKWKIAVCTNKTQALADQLLSELKLTHYFDAIVGADSVTEKKPSARHVVETIMKAGGSQESKSLLVGDSSTDGRAAEAAGIPFILMTYGYPDGDLSSLSMVYSLETARDLPAALSAALS